MVLQLNHQLTSLLNLLENLTNDQYSLKSDLLFGASVGAHTRHSLEFIQEMIEGAEIGKICYDARERKVNIEEEVTKAISFIKKLQNSIPSLDLKKQVKVYGDLSYEASEIVAVSSNLERELMNNIEHCIHHFALIKVLVKNHFPEVVLDTNFGIAPSTIKHYKECVQ